MNGDRRNSHVSEYFGRSAQPASKPHVGTSYSRNNGIQQSSLELVNPKFNEKRGIQLMTVTRKPNNVAANKNFPKATMQFHGITNNNAYPARQAMDTTSNQSANSGNRKQMETAQDIPQLQLTQQEKTRFLTGTIEKVMKWHRIMKDFCHYEVIGPVVSIQEGNIPLQKVMLLRDKKGPVLKIVHYIYDRIDLPNFHIGQVVRCVGRMICPNTIQAIIITEATEQEISFLPRLSAKCDQEIAIYQRDNN